MGNKAREKMRLEGMKRGGVRREWLSKSAWNKVVRHEQDLASERDKGVLDKKPSTYRLKPKRRS